MANECYYFGCWRRPGHFLYRPDGLTTSWPGLRNQELDCILCPQDKAQPEGSAALSVRPGEFTVLSFWDRTGDSRMNSNSNFVMSGEHDFDSAVQTAREAFPEVWERICFEVRLVEKRNI